jgi:serine/threonine-protein kinase RsbW
MSYISGRQEQLARQTFAGLAVATASEADRRSGDPCSMFTISTTMPLSRDASAGSLVEVVIPSDTTEARRVQDAIEQLLKKHEFTDKDIFGIRLALEEALVNAIKHGNQMDRDKKVAISYTVHLGRFEIHITDEGSGFEPSDVPDPTAVENIERPSGRGLMLMRHYMTEVSFHGRGNSVRMFKVLRNGKK